MVNELARLTFWFLLGLIIAIIPFAVIVTFRLFTVSSKQELKDDSWSPKATVILSLRGADPFLPDCLLALLNQNYPAYSVHIIIDSREDEAWDIVDKTLYNFGATIPVKVSALQEKRPSCSLKCSALIQAIADLEHDCEIVALVDADTLTHSNWLRELVSPFSDPTVGATTGNRWYVPDNQLWGSLVRYLGNVPTVVHMCIHDVPWGGTLAIKTQALSRSQLLEQWSQGLVEDVPVHRAMQKQGLRVQFIPSLIMVNREQCSLSNYLPWIKRQLLCVRLYHPSWIFVVVHGMVTALVPLFAVGLLLVALFSHQWEATAWIAGGLFCSLFGQALVVSMLEQGVRRVVRRQREVMPETSVMTMLKTLIAIPLTQLIFMRAIMSAMMTRYIDWRGITYEIKGPWDIRLVDYRSYRHSKSSAMQNTSL
jgi:cellulose synthase/poly-beta-1,6-N-acetylglucosamine synthase-like glycosyltransferase